MPSKPPPKARLQASTPRGLTPRSKAVCAWIEAHLRNDAGEPFRLAPYQVSLIKSYYAGDLGGPRRCRRAILSTAKKNGKSALAAATLVVDMAMPGVAEMGAHHFTASGASKDQSGIVWKHCAKMIRRNPRLARRFHIVDGAQRMAYAPTQSSLWALPSTSRGVQGVEPRSFVFDELAQAHTLDLWNALDSAQVKRDCTALVVSTNSTLAGNPLRELIASVEDRRRAGEDVSDWHLALYAGSMTVPHPFGIVNIRKANPGLKGSPPILEEDILIRNRDEAMGNPQLRQYFIAYRLNAEAGNTAPLVDIETWRSLAIDAKERANIENSLGKDSRCYVGVDLSRSVDLSAVVAYFPATGYLLPMAWAPKASIQEAEMTDKNPYRAWSEAGAMRLCEGTIIDAEEIADYIIDLMSSYDVREVRYDPAYTTQLWMAMRAKGHEPDSEEFKAVFKAHSQGIVKMTGSVADFERLVKNAEIKHPDNPVLNANMVACSVETSKRSGADWRRPVKAALSSRIDLAVASIMAVAGDLTGEAAKPREVEPMTTFYEAWNR